jgi:hypothetical protein
VNCSTTDLVSRALISAEVLGSRAISVSKEYTWRIVASSALSRAFLITADIIFSGAISLLEASVSHEGIADEVTPPSALTFFDCPTANCLASMGNSAPPFHLALGRKRMEWPEIQGAVQDCVLAQRSSARLWAVDYLLSASSSSSVSRRARLERERRCTVRQCILRRCALDRVCRKSDEIRPPSRAV